MQFLDIPAGFFYGRTAIIVECNELDIFKQYVQKHDIHHGYTNFDSVLKRIKNQHTQVTFYYEAGRLHYYTPGCAPRYMQRISMVDLYEENDHASDILALLT